MLNRIYGCSEIVFNFKKIILHFTFMISDPIRRPEKVLGLKLKKDRGQC